MWQKAVRDAIVQYSDPRALASHLCQKGLLDIKDLDFRSLTGPKDSEEFMVKFIDALPAKGPDAYSRFEQCIKDSQDHLGHHYITGADPEVEEGGAHIEWIWCSHAARAARRIFLCERITHSILGGSGGMLP